MSSFLILEMIAAHPTPDHTDPYITAERCVHLLTGLALSSSAAAGPALLHCSS
jgi:hypothetical protein